MPIGPVRGYPVGNARAFVAEIVQSGTYAGYFSGQQASLTAGTASGVYVMSDVKSSAFSVIAPTDVNIEGGDRIQATASFSGSKLSAFDVTVSSIDTVLVDLIGGSTTNNTNSEAAVMGYNAYRTSPKVMFFASQQMFETSTGFLYFVTRVVPRASLSFRPGSMSFRGASDSMIHVNSIVNQRWYQGQSYGTGGLNLGLEEDSADWLDIFTANPITFVAFKQDAIATTFNTVYKPLSTVVTVNATTNQFAIGGVNTALSSITLAGVVTLAAAGTTGVMDILTHETNFVPV